MKSLPRSSTPRSTILLVGLAMAVLLSAPATAAQISDSPRWLPWLGCWELVNQSSEQALEPVEGERTVCLLPVDAGVELTTRVDGRVVLAQTVVADGLERSVQDGGCAGTEQTTWSADGSRLFVTADLVCDGGHRRQTSGISMLAAGGRWTDIQVAEADGHREILVKIYRRTEAPGVELPRAIRTDLALAASTARQAASAPLDAEDVIEALQRVDQAAVEAMLMESGTGFDLDVDVLMQLADNDVPGSVVDLMVALSYPDYFMVNNEDDEAYDRRADRYGGRGGYVSGWFYPSYYGYYSPAFSPFSYGYYYSPIRPITINPGSTYGGKVVKGRGYTRVQSRGNLPGGGLSRLFSQNRARGSGGGGSGSGGSVTRQGATSGSSGSSGGTAKPRTAKPRGGG